MSCQHSDGRATFLTCQAVASRGGKGCVHQEHGSYFARTAHTAVNCSELKSLSFKFLQPLTPFLYALLRKVQERPRDKLPDPWADLREHRISSHDSTGGK